MGFGRPAEMARLTRFILAVRLVRDRGSLHLLAKRRDSRDQWPLAKVGRSNAGHELASLATVASINRRAIDTLGGNDGIASTGNQRASAISA